MRLARQAAQLNFEPDEECLLGATENAPLIEDISPERIYEELISILISDEKCGVKNAPYHGMQILEKTGVLSYILPELAKGKGLTQRSDYHKYDVLEHSFKALLYMEKQSKDSTLRLAALLHDVGKPLCILRDGNAYNHPIEGELLAREILLRLKAPKKTIQKVCWLVKNHMLDFNCMMSENKLRRFFVSNRDMLRDLLFIKQADFSACMDNMSKAPTCTKWENLLAKMQEECVPFSLKELAVNGNDLLQEGFLPQRIATLLNELFLHTAIAPMDNVKERLLRLAHGLNTSLSQ
jgi:tRNA nucleotidyltransferase/poly(A) polymerase